jgi:hypothetical protein
MPEKFNIYKAGDNEDSHDLIGLEIQESADNGYELVVPRTVLARSASRKLPVHFRFKDFHKADWTVTIKEVTPFEMKGSWINNVISSEESDNWVASGGGAGDPDEDEAQAASAK